MIPIPITRHEDRVIFSFHHPVQYILTRAFVLTDASIESFFISFTLGGVFVLEIRHGA